MILYRKDDNSIFGQIPDDQNIETFLHYLPEDFISNIGVVHDYLNPKELYNYKVIDGNLVKMSNLEISEISEFGKVLTEEERLLNALKPSYEDVKNAEQTIEILSLLQEVL